MLSRLTRTMLRTFCSGNQMQKTAGSAVIQSEKGDSTPVHLRPYDRAKYEKPLQKIKLNSGYAFLEIQPFPRAKIMKICYHILEQLTIGFPQNCVYRIYNEERTKYMMKIVDQTTDVEELEDFFGVQIIEIFIDNLAGQLEIINHMRHSKIWNYQNDENYDPNYMLNINPKDDPKNPKYRKPQRPKTSFVEE